VEHSFLDPFSTRPPRSHHPGRHGHAVETHTRTMQPRGECQWSRPSASPHHDDALAALLSHVRLRPRLSPRQGLASQRPGAAPRQAHPPGLPRGPQLGTCVPECGPQGMAHHFSCRHYGGKHGTDTLLCHYTSPLACSNPCARDTASFYGGVRPATGPTACCPHTGTPHTLYSVRVGHEPSHGRAT